MRTKKVIQSALEETELSSLHISVSDKPAGCTDSRFGGVFYLPHGESVPACPEGETMQFLAQINFAKIPHLDGFPEKGLLQFFLDTDEMRFEEKIDDPERVRQLYAVRYYPEPDVRLQQDVEIQRFMPAQTITTVTLHGETIPMEEYEKRLREAKEKEGKPVSIFLSMMEGKPLPPYVPSELSRLRSEAKFHTERIPGHLDLPWLDGKMAFRSAAEVATVYVGMDGLVSDLGYEDVCSSKVTPDLVIRQSGYDLENNESAADALCWDFGNWGTKIGGHPAVHQADSRADLEDGGKYTSLLFQYDFATKSDMEADVFQFFIRPEDLVRARFDDVLLCWHNCF